MGVSNPSKTIGSAIAISVLVALSACDMFSGNKYDNGLIDAPFEGTFRVGSPMDSETYYKIAIADDRGQLVVETNGREERSYEFTVAGENALEFDDVQRGPYELAMPLKVDEFKSIVRLERPPTKLTFDEQTPREKDTANEGQFFHIEGLFVDIPLPITMFRVADDALINIPFRPIEWDADVSVSRGLVKESADGEGTTDSGGTWVKKPEVKGEIRSLKIDGQDVKLKSTEIKDGLLSTQEFGDIVVEASAPGTNSLNLFANLDQIRDIRTWLDSQ